MKRAIQSILSIAAALALSLPVSSAFAAGPPDATTVPKLLAQVKQHAAQVNRDAEILESYRFTMISWQSYAAKLAVMKENANALFQDYYALQRIKDKATPSQQEAIDRIEPLLREMATAMTNTILWLNKHHSEVQLPTFQNHVHTSVQKINAVYEFMCKCTNKNVAI